MDSAIMQYVFKGFDAIVYKSLSRAVHFLARGSNQQVGLGSSDGQEVRMKAKMLT